MNPKYTKVFKIFIRNHFVYWWHYITTLSATPVAMNFPFRGNPVPLTDARFMFILYAYASLEQKVNQNTVTYVKIHYLFVTYFRNIENQ